MNYTNSDEYVEYLKKNCGVRGYDVEEQSPSFTGAGIDVFLHYLKSLDIQKSDSVLEIGCGLGRLLKESYDFCNCSLFGIDNNPKLIELAKERVGKITKELKTSNAENITFPDSYFNKIFCWGVFELCEQEKTLLEMIRCLKIDGLLLITGKSNLYHFDDLEAYSAEVAVTEKDIMHSFTDYDNLLEFTEKVGLIPIQQQFFERRGYFMKSKSSSIKPPYFYEWLTIFRKIKNNKIEMNTDQFSSKHSRVYYEKQ